MKSAWEKLRMVLVWSAVFLLLGLMAQTPVGRTVVKYVILLWQGLCGGSYGE